MRKRLCGYLVIAAICLLPTIASAVVTLDWVTIGDPGNAADVGGWGAVPYVYRTGRYEVSNAEYTEFLNAVAATDTYTLYNPGMGSSGSITRTGSFGSYSYSVVAGSENEPVEYVSFFDGVRFSNWLHNSQPTGPQGPATTETGAYTLAGAASVGDRNPGAKFFLPTEDEWYKAAYYDSASTSYFDYPAASDTPIVCAMPGSTSNTANCGAVVNDVTDIGSYVGSPSPNGTFDQGGNVWEWNESILTISVPPPSYRGVRGGSYANDPITLEASFSFDSSPIFEDVAVGLRIAALPTSTPTGNTTVGTFVGGDAGEGLDLDGTFEFAVNVGEPIGGRSVRDATFSIDTSTSGFALTSAVSGIPPFGGGAIPHFGFTTNDDNLEVITREHRFSADATIADDLRIDLTVTPDATYKLQLIMTEVYAPTGTGSEQRVFDVWVENALIVDDFDPTAIAGIWTFGPEVGAVITHELTAVDGILNIVLEDLEIQNPMLSALTLEIMPAPVPTLTPIGFAVLGSLMAMWIGRTSCLFRMTAQSSSDE